MSGPPRGNGRRAVLILVAGSILFCLLLLAWLFPSLKRYRSTAAPRAAAMPVTGAPERTTGEPGGAAPPAPGGGAPTPTDGAVEARGDTAAARALLAGADGGGTPGEPLIVAEESEGGGRVRIEPAPFQPPPRRVEEPPPPPPPAGEQPPAAASAPEAPAAGGAGGPGAGGPAAAEVGPAPVLEPPVVLKAAWLRYPESARKRRLEGSVEVRILVAETGGVKDVQLVTGAGDTALDNAALGAARATLFRPAHLGTEPVAVWYNYRFVFSVPHDR